MTAHRRTRPLKIKIVEKDIKQKIAQVPSALREFRNEKLRTFQSKIHFYSDLNVNRPKCKFKILPQVQNFRTHVSFSAHPSV